MAVREGTTALARLHNELDRMFEDFAAPFPAFPVFRPFQVAGFMPEGGRWMPAIDFYEKDNHLVVEAEVPGILKENLKVGCTDHTLTIQGETKKEEEEKKEGYYRAERRYGMFYRAVPLPEDVDYGKAEAKYENGVLRVMLPKVPRPETAPRTIPLQ